jgi:hypothetical protein
MEQFEPTPLAGLGWCGTLRLSGRVQGSEEITLEWFDVESVPSGQMWDDQSSWLPRVLEGDRLAGTITNDDSALWLGMLNLSQWKGRPARDAASYFDLKKGRELSSGSARLPSVPGSGAG